MYELKTETKLNRDIICLLRNQRQTVHHSDRYSDFFDVICCETSINDEVLVPRENAFDYDYTAQWPCVRVTSIVLLKLCITPPHALFTRSVTIETNNDHSVLIATLHAEVKIVCNALVLVSCHEHYVRPIERGGNKSRQKSFEWG